VYQLTKSLQEKRTTHILSLSRGTGNNGGAQMELNFC
jgi:hypothetical protein